MSSWEEEKGESGEWFLGLFGVRVVLVEKGNI